MTRASFGRLVPLPPNMGAMIRARYDARELRHTRGKIAFFAPPVICVWRYARSLICASCGTHELRLRGLPPLICELWGARATIRAR